MISFMRPFWHCWLILLPALAFGVMTAHAQAPPAPAAPAPPSCEDRLAATAAYADLLKQVRDQYEQRIAELAAKVQALERAAAPGATKSGSVK